MFQREKSAVELDGDAPEERCRCGAAAAAASIKHNGRRLPGNSDTQRPYRGRTKPRQEPAARSAHYQIERRRD